MKKHSCRALCAFCSLLLFSAVVVAQNRAPVIENLQVSADWSNNRITVRYDVADAEGNALDIQLELSNDDGKRYVLTPVVGISGDVGFPVTPGNDRVIVCDVAALPPSAAQYRLRLTADDRQPFDLQALVNEVDSNRLRADLQFVEGIRHRTAGATHLAAVRDSMKRIFVAAGLYTEEHTFAYSNSTGRNAIGTARGTGQSQKVVIVDAHYDTVSNAPGADDNGSGTVGVWEIARLLSRYPTKKTVRFIGFDLEEAGLIGSTRYVSNGIPAGDSIEGVLNFEMIGFYTTQPNTQTLPAGFNILFPDAYNAVVGNQSRGDFITNVGNTASAALGTLFANAAAQYVPGLRVVSLNVPGNGSIAPDLQRSDHAPFWLAGHKALMLTDGANFRNKNYHTTNDKAAQLNFTFMSNVVKATLAAAAQLAEIQHGDWATTTVDKPVSTQTPTVVCNARLTVSPRDRSALLLHLPESCPSDDVSIELYDAQGRSVLSRQLQQLGVGKHRIELPMALPNGAYVAKLRIGGYATAKVLTLGGMR